YFSCASSDWALLGVWTVLGAAVALSRRQRGGGRNGASRDDCEHWRICGAVVDWFSQAANWNACARVFVAGRLRGNCDLASDWTSARLSSRFEQCKKSLEFSVDNIPT